MEPEKKEVTQAEQKTAAVSSTENKQQEGLRILSKTPNETMDDPEKDPEWESQPEVVSKKEIQKEAKPAEEQDNVIAAREKELERIQQKREAILAQIQEAKKEVRELGTQVEKTEEVQPEDD